MYERVRIRSDLDPRRARRCELFLNFFKEARGQACSRLARTTAFVELCPQIAAMHVTVCYSAGGLPNG
jgi:hypothetical protein